MKSKYWILLNMQMLRYWNPLFFHREKSGKGNRKNLAVGVGIAVVGMVTMLYSGMAAYGYTQMGAAHMIPRLMSSLSAWMTFLFLFLKSEGALFGCKDFDLMGSLPVGTAVIAAVRVTFAYLTGLFISFLIMLPAFAVYAVYERAGAGEFLLLLVLIFTIPILPTVQSASFSPFLFAFAQSRASLRVSFVDDAFLFSGTESGSAGRFWNYAGRAVRAYLSARVSGCFFC